MGFIDIFPALSNPRTTSGNKFYLPIQTIPYTQKDENWQKDCMDFFTTQWMTNSYRRREKIVNYKPTLYTFHHPFIHVCIRARDHDSGRVWLRPGHRNFALLVMVDEDVATQQFFNFAHDHFRIQI